MAKLKLKDLYFDVVKSLQGDLMVIEQPKLFYHYTEGIKGAPAGWDYSCLSEGLNYEKVNIKVYGSTEPQIEYEGKPVRVAFEGLEGKVWQDWNNNGEIKLSITAKSICPLIEKTRLKLNSEDKA